MSNLQGAVALPPRSLRLWLGVAIVASQWALRFGLPVFLPDALPVAVVGGILGGLLVFLWWAFFARAPRRERREAGMLTVAGLAGTWFLLDRSIATGMMGMMFAVYSIPVLSLAFVAWAVLTRNLSDAPRRATMAAAILLATGGWALLRTNGITGDASSDFAWRWSKTHEEHFIAHALSAPAAPAPFPETLAPAEPAAAPAPRAALPAPSSLPEEVPTQAGWPGFRGPHRDGVVTGVRLETDWTAHAPVELWRRPVGPGWSSFAVRGNRIYSQEQRGEEEVVSCYNAATGAPVWTHRDRTRFWESNAGPGPRGTPTLHRNRVYTFGATGILNALDSRTGAVLWSRNAADDLDRKIPAWGFSSSPLVAGELVVVAVSGRLAAYEAENGTRRWTGEARGPSYSSPHLLSSGGVEQIVLMSEQGAASVAPADGKLLWTHSWPGNVRIVQPAITPEGDLLLEGGQSTGLRRIALSHGPAGLAIEERWTSRGLKPYFNDFVVHEGHVYGFDGGILACINSVDGSRKWKGGRYGHGQLILLRDQGLLLVISEEGILALVKADPESFSELARLPALNGKTWNHPVIAGDRLYLRNADEMAAYRLSLMQR